MMDFVINGEELAVMSGLPHIQQLTYLRGIRLYMDLDTGLVGIKRRISYQSISAQLTIEPHQGIKAQSFSRDQVRRAVFGLVRIGLIEVQSEDKQLILKCPLASRAFSVQNKAAINPPQKATTNPHEKILVDTGASGVQHLKADIVELPKAATPLLNNNYYIYLLAQFEKFWSLYPEKKSKQKAQVAFEQLNPDNSLFQQLILALQKQTNHIQTMKAAGAWVPPWKYPANWLAQRCWEDELSTDALEEISHAAPQTKTRKPDSRADMFCPPCDDEETDTGSNVVQFKQYVSSGATN